MSTKKICWEVSNSTILQESQQFYYITNIITRFFALILQFHFDRFYTYNKNKHYNLQLSIGYEPDTHNLVNIFNTIIIKISAYYSFFNFSIANKLSIYSKSLLDIFHYDSKSAYDFFSFNYTEHMLYITLGYLNHNSKSI